MYSLYLDKEKHHFCSAHFIVFDENNRELLHGHNYYVSLEVNGQSLQQSKLIDIAILKDHLKTICDSLDHKLLLPSSNDFLTVRKEGDQIVCSYNNDTFRFPDHDCLILDMENTTMELLAKYIQEQLEAQFDLAKYIDSITVIVQETNGQSASYTKHLKEL